ncbi:hypothetical protein CPC16_007733 [Podila verticillata]|nr:hypothetical protein CPC16_007733 [Podila verticillata]
MSPPRSQPSSLDVLGGTCSVLEGKAPPTVLNTRLRLLVHGAAVFMLLSFNILNCTVGSGILALSFAIK